jgi:hypothetical protein
MATARKIAGESRLGRLTALALEEITAMSMELISHSMAAAKVARDKHDIQGLYTHAKTVELAGKIKEISKLARMCKFEEEDE